jgi:glucose-6-phosphate 1-epimerase
MKIQDINDQFAIGQHIFFESGQGELPMAQIRNMHATATVSLQGAQVVAWQPQGEAPVIWHSRCSLWTAGKAIRGGIPVCWPWFGPDPSASGKPQHGFVRTMLWNVVTTDALPDGATQLRLGLRDDDTSHALIPHHWALELVVTVGQRLDVELVVRNASDEAWQYSAGLHSYFGVGDITEVAVDGLDGTRYIDKVDGGAVKTQHGSVTITEEIDRIFLDTTAPCVIDDRGLGRRIVVEKQWSRSTVVWNPWIEKARAMPDMCDEEYRGMVCLETTNAGPDTVTLAPGEQGHLQATISVERRDEK